MLHFVWSYYRNCYRKGYRLDIWHYALFFNLFVIHIMLPFSRSNLNVFALGPEHLRQMQGYVTEAYFVSAFGYVGILLGGSLWRVRSGLGLRSIFAELLELPTRGSLLMLQSRNLLVLHGVLASLLMAGILLYYFREDGFGFNLRGLLLVRPALRPIAQFSAFYSVLIGSYCFSRFAETKDRTMLVITGVIISGLLFFGERGNLAAVIATTGLVFAVALRERLKLYLLALGGAFLIVMVLLLDALRRPDFSLDKVMGGFMLNLFYGNSFSDTRDFALILSLWNGVHFFGLTYLAGIFSFVPRVLSPFRDTWSLGVVTARMAGFAPTEHPGLRIGIFGEAYLNFGLLGVFLLSVFIGAAYRLLDLRVKQSIAARSDSGMRVYSYFIITLVVVVAENTSAASTLYSTLLIFFVSWLMIKASRSVGIRLG